MAAIYGCAAQLRSADTGLQLRRLHCSSAERTALEGPWRAGNTPATLPPHTARFSILNSQPSQTQARPHVTAHRNPPNATNISIKQ